MQFKKPKFMKRITLVLVFFFLSGCKSTEDAVRFQINNLTDIEIPSTATLVYNRNNEVFSGRISRYCVFDFDEKPVAFLTNNNFSDTKSRDFENDFDQDIVSFIDFLAREYDETIPDQYYVNWDEDYSWLYHIEGIYFIYIEMSQLLIIRIVGH